MVAAVTVHLGQLRDSIPAALIVQNVVAQISHNNNFNNINVIFILLNANRVKMLESSLILKFHALALF